MINYEFTPEDVGFGELAGTILHWKKRSMEEIC